MMIEIWILRIAMGYLAAVAVNAVILYFIAKHVSTDV